MRLGISRTSMAGTYSHVDHSPSTRMCLSSCKRVNSKPCVQFLRVSLVIWYVLFVVRPISGAAPQPFESIWYTPGSGAARLSEARAHINQISVIAPQAFWATADGELQGEVSDSLMMLARESGTRVMPLIVNRGFNQETIHTLLNNRQARKRCVREMVSVGLAKGFWGWQFDFENVHISDRDSLTAFFNEAAAALHDAGMTISVAVVPTNGSFGNTSFSRFMHENWRGSFDVGAMAKAGDFISLMTYAQHGGSATPGPVSGLPWIREMLEYALAEGVPIEKISLGLPSYSGYWFSSYSEQRGARVAGREIAHARAIELLGASKAKTIWLERQGVSYSFWENSGTFEWLFLEDERSFRKKMILFESYPDLRGISVWVLGAEDTGVWSVLSMYTDE